LTLRASPPTAVNPHSPTHGASRENSSSDDTEDGDDDNSEESADDEDDDEAEDAGDSVSLAVSISSVSLDLSVTFDA
jgi:hypothetical protein